MKHVYIFIERKRKVPVLLAVEWYRTGQLHFLTRSSSKNIYKRKRFRASHLKWENMLQMQQLWPSGECKTKQQMTVHLQPLAFLKLVLELIYFLLLTLKHNKVHKSISKHSLGIVRWLWRTTTWTSAITEAFRTGMANKKCAQNRTRITWLGRCRTCTSDKQTFLCVFSQLR